MAKTNVWLSVSDLMTGLMVIFLFVAIAYISRVQKNQSVLTDYVETKNELHNKLVKEFEGDTLKWQMTIGNRVGQLDWHYVVLQGYNHLGLRLNR